MNNKTNFILNGSLIAFTTLLLRLTGLGFSAFITRSLGAEGTGLISLVSTVYGFGITVAVSGIFLACMRLCSAALARKDYLGLQIAMQKSFLHAVAFGFAAMFLLYLSADYLGNHFLGDARTVQSIRILCAALPCIALNTVTDSYFTCVGRVYKSAIADCVEQTVKILASIVLLRSATPFGLEASIAAATKGSCMGEIAAFVASCLLYLHDRKKHTMQNTETGSKKEGLLRISLPIAVSTYARSGLVTLEHSLIPKGLQAYGRAKSDALADYGIIRGMALPVVLFPACILSAFTGLLIPEFTKDHTTNNKKSIDRKASLSLKLAGVFSSVTAALLFCYGNDLGLAIYKNEKAGQYIRCFSILIPFMYCDTTADAILKGLDKQIYTMLVNILDAGISVLLTWRLLPKFGVIGYIVTVFATEILNFSCSAGKLASITTLQCQPLHAVVFPACCSLISGRFTQILLHKMHIRNALQRCIFGIGGSLAIALPMAIHFSELHPFKTKKTVDSHKGNPLRKSAEISR